VTTRLPRRSALIRPLRDFLATEAAGGVVVVAAAIAAMIWANSPFSGSYRSLWNTDIGLHLGTHAIDLDLRHWVNDGLMTIFFFVVGLEIKRELVEGELRDRRKAIVPVAAAIGGMAVPALIYVALNHGTPSSRGWGIPMATDIALAIGLLSLAGSRIHPGAKLFLLALAIVDDIGAIIVIALFYGQGGDRVWMIGAVASVASTLVLQRLGVNTLAIYIALGVLLWFSLHEAGIHATIAGVVMGLLAPTRPALQEDLIDVDELVDLSSAEQAITTAKIARSSVSVVEWLEYKLHSWTSLLVVPVFALANAGIAISSHALSASLRARTTWGVALGLVVGKPVGILLATYLVVRVGAGAVPSGVSWSDLAIAAVVAGVGFTVSIFVAELAFGAPFGDEAKIGVVVGSVVAATIGLTIARLRRGESNRLADAAD
jgi:Na+:H+ antiporter, NhaA family